MKPTRKKSDSAHDHPPVAALKLEPAAKHLGGLSKLTMYRLIKRGLLKPNRATRHLLFPISELDRFLRE
jgi:Helix-turn-helix domain